MEKRTYINNGGAHTGLDGVVTERGKTIETEEDLIAKFGSRFELVTPAAPVLPPGVEQVGPVAAQGNEVAAAATTGAAGVANPGIGVGMDDVTDEWPEAKAGDLTVCHDKRGWWVFDGTVDAANEKALKKKDVATFIKEYLAV